MTKLLIFTRRKITPHRQKYMRTEIDIIVALFFFFFKSNAWFGLVYEGFFLTQLN